MSEEDEQTVMGVGLEVVRFIIGVTLVAVILATIFGLFTPVAMPDDVVAQADAAQNTADTAPAAPTDVAVENVNGPRIGIVVGHLGSDAGAVCPDDESIHELDINIAIADATIVRLQELGYVVDRLEEFDTRLDGYAGEALVSIHADSCSYINDEATGFKVAGSLDNQVPELSARLVGCISERYGRRTQMKYHSGSVTYDMTYYHAYREVAPTTPAAIIEVGFMLLDRDLLLNQPDLLAQGIAEGVRCYIEKEAIKQS